MLHCVIEIRSATASFRNPEFQNFHKSFLLPPPTTLIGLAGAALGLNPKAAQNLFDTCSVRAGVYGKTKGMSRDLWKYDTLPGRSVITKEVYFDVKYWIVFGSFDVKFIHQLKSAFESPIYALTMGSSDSLAKVVKVELIEGISKKDELENTLIEGDIVQMMFDQAIRGGEFAFGINETDPIAYQLPVRFDYDSDYGLRKVSKRKLFSFIGSKVKITKELFIGVSIDSLFIPTFPL